MSKNIEININTGNDTYEILYPKISLTNNEGTTLPLTSTSGTLGVSRGGTGVTSWNDIISNVRDYLTGFSRSSITSYVGDGISYGSSNPKTFTFDFVPSVVYIKLYNYSLNSPVLKQNGSSFYVNTMLNYRGAVPMYNCGLSSWSSQTGESVGYGGTQKGIPVQWYYRSKTIYITMDDDNFNANGKNFILIAIRYD